MAVENEHEGFDGLGLHQTLVDACKALKWSRPTPIQLQAIPPALEGKDVIGLAETGSGKTGAFTLPILHRLLQTPTKLFACILAPTRELAFQINDVVQALGTSIGVKSVTIVGGVDMMTQAIGLAKKPHVIVGTPGRLVDHLEHTKGFSLRGLKMLVLDEADRMLSMDFETELNTILESIGTRDERQTLLFSATMTKKVSKLQRASLKDPVKISISGNPDDFELAESKKSSKNLNEISKVALYKTAETLQQSFVFIPAKHKEIYLIMLLKVCFQGGKLGLIFVSTCSAAEMLTLMINNLRNSENSLTRVNFDAVCLHGQMPQVKRLSALNKFKSGSGDVSHGRVMLATDVASRGLDIPNVDFVLNFDVPNNGKDYIHRVGRTARAGKSGLATTIVTQYDIELFQRVEHLLGYKLEENSKLPTKEQRKQIIEDMTEDVVEAKRIATNQLKAESEETSRKRKHSSKFSNSKNSKARRR